jgi:AcrR family transcriptional regulator
VSPRRTLEEALETRERVLDAAFRTTRGGGGRFTVDAVAKEAGVSKGAVLHHFPSKEALAVGMLERQLDEFDGLIERHLAEEPEGKPGRWLRAYVRASFEVGAGDPAVNDALLAAMATEPDLLSSFEGRFESWRQRAEADGVDRTRANLVRLAVDGLATAESFGLGAPEGEEREDLLEALIELTGVEQTGGREDADRAIHAAKAPGEEGTGL